ncbi:MAG: hypothetical protein FJZ58_02025 [Chlamydiae bacterium]|nr:hypothetical protein [Chlamydiota bacterium]
MSKIVQELNRKGWWLSPGEGEDSLVQRKQLAEKNWSMEKGILSSEAGKRTEYLYDFSLEQVPLLRENKSLFPWQAAVVWSYEAPEGGVFPVVQLRKKVFPTLVSQEEILAHESVHVARFAFHEPWFEEILAYQTSQSFWRRFFGPLFVHIVEPIIAIAALWGGVMGFIMTGSLWWYSFAVLCWGGALVRLLLLQGLFFLARRRIASLGAGHRALAVLCRLSDKEIVQAALFSCRCWREKIFLQKSGEVRWREIVATYFERSWCKM